VVGLRPWRLVASRCAGVSAVVLSLRQPAYLGQSVLNIHAGDRGAGIPPHARVRVPLHPDVEGERRELLTGGSARSGRHARPAS